MGDNPSGFQTLLGPFPDVENTYLVTRHPLATVANVKPFGSLGTNFWTNYLTLYVIFTLAAVCAEIKLIRDKVDMKHIFMLLVFPSESRWFKWGLSISLAWSFTIWTFSQLYGVDLHAALVGQTFEGQVNEWGDLNFMDTQFIYMITANYYGIQRLVAPSFLELNLMFERRFFSSNKCFTKC